MHKIIAISLIRNEDIYIEKVVRNILMFSDEVIIADNMSTDNTYKIVNKLEKKYDKVHVTRIKHTRDSHKLVEKYIGTSTWVFVVDGDEIYDINGLDKMRTKILNGDFDDWWAILPNMLHCVKINNDNTLAQGYLAPPSLSGTRLFNFNIITEWSNCKEERMHSGNLKFKKGFDASRRLMLHEKYSWDESFFRCLHLCFVPRSSTDKIKSNKFTVRKNPAENAPLLGFKGFLRYISYKIRRINTTVQYKLQNYKKGNIIEKNVSIFFQNKSLIK